MKESFRGNFDECLNSFQRSYELAKKLITPNQSDDLSIRLAIVGFSYNEATEEWNFDHYRYVNKELQSYRNQSEFEEDSHEYLSNFFAL